MSTLTTSNPKPTQVFIGNIPWKTKWTQLKDICKKYGDVKRVDIAEVNGRSKGYGIAIFTTAEEAHKCIEGLHEEEFEGRTLTVKLDEKLEQTARMMEMLRISHNNFSNGMPMMGGPLNNMMRNNMMMNNMMRNNMMRNNMMGNNMMGNNMMGNNMMRNNMMGAMGEMDMMGRMARIDMMRRMNGSFQTPPQRPQMKTDPECQVFVGNLPWVTKWQELKDLCKKFGSVKRADIAEENGRSKGYGIVIFSSKESAQSCVSDLNGTEFNGRTLNVKTDEKPWSVQYNQRTPIGNHVLTSPGMMGGFNGTMGSSSSVFVGNLPWSVKWQNLKDLCRPFGNVIRANIEENDEGKSKGYGIVKFDNPNSAQNCVANLHGQMYGGRNLNVNIDKFDQTFNNKGPVHVFVGNLPWSFNRWQDLKDLCRNFGDVIRADIEEEEKGRSKGYGIVTFANAIGAQNCLHNLNGQFLHGRALVVKFDQFKGKKTRLDEHAPTH